MFNCYVLFCNNVQFAVVRSELAATNVIDLMIVNSSVQGRYHYEGRYIPGVGF